ncbi:hypothetical protein HID58_078132 [Brassica napus]|uniref:MHD domain-containing protein n=1 Tax=Brassica napus TaxID=3708 RepID=A0ABQ7YTR5_BRANA|nr:hypothetical protein HID58_078132 [Brassica napus]
MMISQFFVLSQRGDNIVFRDYRAEVPKGSTETFFRKVKFWKEDGNAEAPPIFNVDGVNYFHVKVVGLYFVATTKVNVSPSLVLELLQRIARVIKDYLGVLNEDSFRKNFVLVYELLDEVIDFGYVQTTSTEVLKAYVFNEPILIAPARLQPIDPAAIFTQGAKRMPGAAVTKPVLANDPGGRRREEIFVDIIEKISVTFSSSGYILTSEIDGTIQMKSYLSGNPEIRLALNEDLNIGRGGGGVSVYDYRSSSGSGVILDDCNFHESVRLNSFDSDRTLSLVPPDGEFPVMNYRMTQEFRPPFHVNTLIEEAGRLKAEVIIKIRAEFPSDIIANTIAVQMPLPNYTCRASFELEHDAIVGGAEHTLRAKLTFSQEFHGNITKEAGPVSMTFTIPMYNVSKLQVKYLQIAKKSSSYNPYRWVRYVTQANSYVARI